MPVEKNKSGGHQLKPQDRLVQEFRMKAGAADRSGKTTATVAVQKTNYVSVISKKNKIQFLTYR